MRQYQKLLNQRLLQEHFNYDPETGILTWKKSTNPRRVKVGDVATSQSGKNGYMYTHIYGISYASHRLIWKLVTGNDPVEEIDHIDTNKINNKWDNLREASRVNNCHNTKISSCNTHGTKGLTFIKSTGKWRATCCINYKKIHIGVFTDKEEAAKARSQYVENYAGIFAREGKDANI